MFFIIPARDQRYVPEKIRELENLQLPYVVVCGENLNLPNVKFRPPTGKFDAVNYGATFIPSDCEIVALNDVDTKIFNLSAAINELSNRDIALVYARVSVKKGPQQSFYPLIDSIRRRLPIAASGELMLIKKDALTPILPLKPCKAEDSYILFKVLGQKRRVYFCETCYVKTERTQTMEKEESYKRRVVGGIYQALSTAQPPASVKLFYFLLPVASPLLLLFGKKGYYWFKGIMHGVIDYLRGDKSGSWKPEYSK